MTAMALLTRSLAWVASSDCRGLKHTPHYSVGSSEHCSPSETVSWFMSQSWALHSLLGSGTPPWLKVAFKPKYWPLSHHATHTQRWACSVLISETHKWSWQVNIYKVIWAHRIQESTVFVEWLLDFVHYKSFILFSFFSISCYFVFSCPDPSICIRSQRKTQRFRILQPFKIKLCRKTETFKMCLQRLCPSKDSNRHQTTTPLSVLQRIILQHNLVSWNHICILYMIKFDFILQKPGYGISGIWSHSMSCN